MREIKFRVYDTTLQRRIEPDYIGLNGECYFTYPSYEGLEIEESKECILAQYTGLKDVYGTEIYEGDIVSFSTDFKTDVIFYDGCYMIDNGHLQLYRCHNACKVIGNIYENPELLSK